MSGLARWWRTVRFLRPSQAAHRVLLAARRKAWERSGGRVERRYRARAASLGPARFEAPGLAAVASYRLGGAPPNAWLGTARDALAGRFEFLGTQPRARARGRLASARSRLRDPALEDAAPRAALRPRPRERGARDGRPALPRPALRAGGELGRLVADRAPRLRDGLLERARRRNAPREPRRGRRRARAPPGRSRERAWLGALLALHALFLRDNLELDLRANHLLRDAAGLVFAQELFGGFADGLALLREQIEEQVLPDGAHIERAPLYHAIVLQDLLEVRAAAGRRGARSGCSHAVARMGGLLDVPAPRRRRAAALRRRLARRARRGASAARGARAARGRGGLPEPEAPERTAACWRWRAATATPCCAPARTAPTSSSATPTRDLLSFELSRGPLRRVTDTGHAAPTTPARSATRCARRPRTTRSRIDGAEQLEAWGSFRVGRRGRAWTRRAAVPERGLEFAWAAHDAYAWLPGRPRPPPSARARPQRRAAGARRACSAAAATASRARLHEHRASCRRAASTCCRCLRGRAAARRRSRPIRAGARRPCALRLSARRRRSSPGPGGWLLRLDGERSGGGGAASERHQDAPSRVASDGGCDPASRSTGRSPAGAARSACGLVAPRRLNLVPRERSHADRIPPQPRGQRRRLLDDAGRPLFAASEERFSRVKMQGGWPRLTAERRGAPVRPRGASACPRRPAASSSA